MTPDADIYRGDQLVGHFTRLSEGIRLDYREDAILPDGFLAFTLRPEAGPITSVDVPPFFLNLLPEGARLRLLIERSRSKDDSLELLLKVGWDSIGDVAVVPHGTGAGATARGGLEHRARVIDPALVNFWDEFQAGLGDQADGAVAGVQEKISAATVAFGVRMQSVPSGILKLNPPRFPRLVQNEEFFLRMARDCGLEVNSASLVSDQVGETGLLVQRFDRKKAGKQVVKYHQEDGCQLLGLVPARKYDVSMRQIAEAIVSVCSAPIPEILRLLQLYAFSYLIGNADLHAKNISVIWRQFVQLTPSYDLLSTLPYPWLDRHMALSIDGKNDHFKASFFADFGRRYGVREKATLAMCERMCSRAEAWLPRLGEIGFEGDVTERLAAEIAQRLAFLRRGL